MKLGFLDVASNKFNGFEAAARECEQQASVALVKMTASEHLKIPVCAKKLFTEQGVDVVLAFVQANLEEDKDILMLVQEKTIDVEIACNRFVFFCVVLDEEWRSAEQLRSVAEQKIAAAILEMVSTMREHQTTASQSPEFTSALGMFASNDYAQSQQSQQSQSSYQESYYPSQQTQPAPEEKEKEHGLFEVGDEEESGTEDTDRPLF
jgi:riboflavin synthase